MERFTVICEWSYHDVFDADEIVVLAESRGEAISKARVKLAVTKAAQWPECRLDRVHIQPKPKSRGTSNEGTIHHNFARIADRFLRPPPRN